MKSVKLKSAIEHEYKTEKYKLRTECESMEPVILEAKHS